MTQENGTIDGILGQIEASRPANSRENASTPFGSAEDRDKPVLWGPEASPESQEGFAQSNIPNATPAVKAAADAKRVCKTPEAYYDAHITPERVGVSVRIPGTLNLDEREAKNVEDEMHDALEDILGRRWHRVESSTPLIRAEKRAESGSKGSFSPDSASFGGAAGDDGPSSGEIGAAMGSPMGGATGTVAGGPGAVLPGALGVGNPGGDYGGTLPNAADLGVGPGLASMIGKTPPPGSGTGFAAPLRQDAPRPRVVANTTSSSSLPGGFGKISEELSDARTDLYKLAGLGGMAIKKMVGGGLSKTLGSGMRNIFQGVGGAVKNTVGQLGKGHAGGAQSTVRRSLSMGDVGNAAFGSALPAVLEANSSMN